MPANHGLTPDEDEELRRLHWFEEHGFELSDDRREMKASIRERDRRDEIRLPRQTSSQVRRPVPPPRADQSGQAG